MSGPVCITGATGFVGSHVVEAFLAAGIPVRAAVRSPDDEEKTAHLKAMAERHGTDLTFHEANLREPGSFDEAVAGCEGVIHVAAVARLAAPNPQAQIVDPSIEGAKNVLSAATKAGVRRVILTSSIAAIGSYRASQDHPLTEADWNEQSTAETDAYGYAKTAAERAVNAFAAASAGCDTHTHTLTAHAHTHAHDTHTNTRTVHTHARFSS